MVDIKKLKNTDSEKWQEVIDEIKKRGYIQRNQEVHDIKPNFSTKENKRYGLLFVFESGGSKGYLSSAKKYVGIFFRYNASSGKIEEIIDGNVKLGKFKEKAAKEKILEKVLEIELTEKSKAIISLCEKKDKINTKDIILIGRTGDGKSALANVLVGEEGSFTEGECSASETNEVKIKEFKPEEQAAKGITYRIIDTPGISHTKLSREEVLSQIVKEVAHSTLCGNLNQVFFVTSGRLTEEEIEAYNVLETVIFKKDISGFTTIVRTNFPNFMHDKKINNDLQKINNKEYNKAFRSIEYDKFIHVDNPPLDVDEITSASSEKKEEKEEAEQTAKDRANINKKVRELSRKILLRRLDECQNKCYKANNELEILSKEITSHVVRIFILELDQEINDETLPGYIRDICNKEIENSVNHINEKIKNYIEEANSNNSFLVNKSSLEKGQIIAKLREIDSRQVAETVTKGLDAAASLATLGGPPGLAVSLVLGVISGSIKIWLQ